MTKVLYFVHDFNLGGAELGLVRLVQLGFFQNAKLRVVAINEGNGELRGMLTKVGVNQGVRALFNKPRVTIPTLAMCFWRLYKELNEYRPDILIVSLPPPNLVGRSLSFIFPKLKVISFEHSSQYAKAIYHPLLKLLSCRVDAVLFDSEATKSGIEKKAFLQKENRRWYYTPLFFVEDNNPKNDYSFVSDKLTASSHSI